MTQAFASACAVILPAQALAVGAVMQSLYKKWRPEFTDIHPKIQSALESESELSEEAFLTKITTLKKEVRRLRIIAIFGIVASVYAVVIVASEWQCLTYLALSDASRIAGHWDPDRIMWIVISGPALLLLIPANALREITSPTSTQRRMKPLKDAEERIAAIKAANVRREDS